MGKNFNENQMMDKKGTTIADENKSASSAMAGNHYGLGNRKKRERGGKGSKKTRLDSLRKRQKHD